VWRQIPLKQQPHRISFQPQQRLHTNPKLADLDAGNQQRPADSAVYATV
jgi:hypothetical protein